MPRALSGALPRGEDSHSGVAMAMVVARTMSTTTTTHVSRLMNPSHMSNDKGLMMMMMMMMMTTMITTLIIMILILMLLMTLTLECYFSGLVTQGLETVRSFSVSDIAWMTLQLGPAVPLLTGAIGALR